MRFQTCFTLGVLLLSAACGSDSRPKIEPDPNMEAVDDPAMPDQTVRVTGQVVDYRSGDPVDGVLSLTFEGLSPAPQPDLVGADFSLDVPVYSAFEVLVSFPPDYRDTLNHGITTDMQDVADVTIALVSEAWLSALSDTFGAPQQPDTGIVIARVVDPLGLPYAGVPSEAFYLDGLAPARGPYFLNPAMQPQAGADQTSGSGIVVFYEVPAGEIMITQNPATNYKVQSPVTVRVNTVSVLTLSVDYVVDDPEIPDPDPNATVYFGADILPIFSARACDDCHAGNGAGREDGGLTLKGGAHKVYQEITAELSPNYDRIRVDLERPDQSLLLTMPSLEDPPDAHPNAPFVTPQDPDYARILLWIQQGALEN